MALAQNSRRNKRKLFFIFGLVVIIVLVAIGSFVTYKTIANSGNKNGCKTDTIEVCVAIKQANVTTADDINIVTTIKNISATNYDVAYGCTDTSPSIVVDGKTRQNLGLCGEAVTYVKLSPGERTEYSQTVAAADIGVGIHKVSTSWDDKHSSEVSVKIISASKSVQKTAEAACLKGINSNFCTSMYVLVKASYYDEKTEPCDVMYRYFSKLGVKQAVDDAVDNICISGTFFYYVPTSKKAYYRAEFMKFEGVKYVSR